jgi:hypothetical protein
MANTVPSNLPSDLPSDHPRANVQPASTAKVERTKRARSWARTSLARDGFEKFPKQQTPDLAGFSGHKRLKSAAK